MCTDNNSPEEEKPWYKKGLRFKCTGCGKCCGGAPGYVWVTKQEIVDIAESLKMPVDIFVRKYIRQKYNRYALIEKRDQNYDCIFLNENKCLIYQVRPTQCRTFPWWKENIISEESWEEVSHLCEGINDEADVVPCDFIEKQSDL